MSSVAVYGIKKKETISTKDNTNPKTKYGLSKLLCEKVIMESEFKNFSILRLCPVFNKNNLEDIKKRVFFPGSSLFKMTIYPNTKYSLTSIGTLQNRVHSIINARVVKNNICNLADTKIYQQNELQQWFCGISIFTPEILFRPILVLALLFPKQLKTVIRINYFKLFYSNLYKNDCTLV